MGQRPVGVDVVEKLGKRMAAAREEQFGVRGIESEAHGSGGGTPWPGSRSSIVAENVKRQCGTRVPRRSWDSVW